MRWRRGSTSTTAGTMASPRRTRTPTWTSRSSGSIARPAGPPPAIDPARHRPRAGPLTTHSKELRTMPRVLIGGFMHEVHTFVDGTLSLDDIRRNGFIATGPEILSPAIGSGQE